MRVVHAVYTNSGARLGSRVLGLRLIEQFTLLMVILFISLELSPWVCLHQRLAVPAAVFGQGITLMDGELRVGEGGSAGNGAPGRPAAQRGGLGGEREQASPGLDL